MLAHYRFGLCDLAGGWDVAVCGFLLLLRGSKGVAINEYAVCPTQTSCRRAGGGTWGNNAG